MKLLLPMLVCMLASCCPFSLFSDKRPGSEPNVNKLCAPILLKLDPGSDLRLDGQLKVMGNWAFFLGDTVNKKGEAMMLRGALSSDSVVLFRKLEGKWLVVEHGIGITDAYYFGWYQEHDIPEGLLEL